MAAVIDFATTSLNPCSLESIPEPITFVDGRLIWVAIISCYQLEEDGTRAGRSDVYFLEADDVRDGTGVDTNTQTSLKFATPFISLPYNDSIQDCGILDGKWWCPKISDSPTSSGFPRWYASAHSTGQISLHCLTIENHSEESEGTAMSTSSSKYPINVTYSGQSGLLGSDDGVLCLSLNWESTQSGGHCNRIVSSYSNGEVAVHDVVAMPNGNDATHGSTAEFQERHRWKAHTMVGNHHHPVEVWSTCFASNGTDNECQGGNIILSGGDDGCLKVWDLRSRLTNGSSYSQVLKPFSAGVTVVSSHPRREHLIACGSYDETICLYDTRYMATRRSPSFQSEPLGGGIWRIQWHPYKDDRILLAAMHGGCRVLQMNGIVSSSSETNDNGVLPSITDIKEFTQHESMAYGADWLVRKGHGGDVGDTDFEAVASCSFYDRAAYIWSVVD